LHKKTGSPVGRPSKLTEKTKEKLLFAIQEGLRYCDCCVLAGITFSTFRNWMIKGEEQAEKGEGDEFLDFFESVKRAEIEAELKLLKKIKGDPSWQPAAWILERRYPDRYGRRERLDVDINTPVTIKIVGRSRDERDTGDSGNE
jgi:hypothetical protein